MMNSKLTTRDISDYEALMKNGLSFLEQYHLNLHDIRMSLPPFEPLPEPE